MSTLKTVIGRFAVAGAIMATAAFAAAQTTNTVTAKFGSAPAVGQDFTVALVNTGAAKDIAGFAFKLQYDSAQVSIAGVSDNTGQPGASIQYTIGAEAATSGAAAPAERILTATTAKDLTNASNLVEIKFVKKPGYVAPFNFQVTDRVSEPVVDGLTGSSLENIPHVFDTTQVNQ